MGYRSRWVSVQGVAVPDVLATLGLVEDGPAVEHGSTGLWLTRRGRHTLVLASGSDAMGRLKEQAVLALAERGAVVWFGADDTLMTSWLAGLGDGREQWALRCNGRAGRTEHEVAGDLPDVVGQALAAAQAQQAKTPDPERVDPNYEVAHAGGEALVGFRHDQLTAPTRTAWFVPLRPVEFEVVEAWGSQGALTVEVSGTWEGGIRVSLSAERRVTLKRLMIQDLSDGVPQSVKSLDEGRVLARGETVVHRHAPGTDHLVVVLEANGGEVRLELGR